MRDELTIAPGQRFETGLIATVRLSNGRAHSQHFTGAGTEATRALGAFCDEHEARVLTLCTPATIYRDMIGSRAYTKRSHTAHRNAAGEPDSWFFAPPPENAVATPERDMLAKIGRMDLLA